MNKCTVSANRLSAYIDDQVSWEEKETIERHLEECQHCKAILTSLENTKEAFKISFPVQEVPTTLDSGYREKLEKQIQKRQAMILPHRIAQRISDNTELLLAKPKAALITAVISIFILTSGLFSFSHWNYSSALPVVCSASGTVRLYYVRTGVTEPLKTGTRVNKEALIKTGIDGEVDLSVPGKYKIRVKQNSEVRPVNLAKRIGRDFTSYQIDKGKILVQTEEGFKGGALTVYTPTANATTCGTGFVVNVIPDHVGVTWVGVLKGSVEVSSRFKEQLPEDAISTVMVESGHKTIVIHKAAPLTPQQFEKEDWVQIQELYQLRQVPQVALLISAGKYRVRELLRPCAIYIYDKEPRTVPILLEQAIQDIKAALQEKDVQRHIEAISKLSWIVLDHPNPVYNVQFEFFIGAYYNYIGHYHYAIETFEDIIKNHPDSNLLSLAQCAIGIVYEEGLRDYSKAKEAYRKVLEKYSDSYEVEEATAGLKRLEIIYTAPPKKER